MKRLDPFALPPEQQDMTAVEERRWHVVECVRRRMWDDLRELGWGEVFDRLRFGWPPARGGTTGRLSESEALTWASALGDQEPAQVLAALDRHARGADGGYRPTCSAVLRLIPGVLSAPTEGENRPNRACGLAPWQTPQAHRAARAAYAAGHPRCSCPMSAPGVVITPEDVMLCADCRGLEWGQLDDALDAGRRLEAVA